MLFMSSNESDMPGITALDRILRIWMASEKLEVIYNNKSWPVSSWHHMKGCEVTSQFPFFFSISANIHHYSLVNFSHIQNV